MHVEAVQKFVPRGNGELNPTMPLFEGMNQSSVTGVTSRDARCATTSTQWVYLISEYMDSIMRTLTDTSNAAKVNSVIW